MTFYFNIFMLIELYSSITHAYDPILDDIPNYSKILKEGSAYGCYQSSMFNQIANVMNPDACYQECSQYEYCTYFSLGASKNCRLYNGCVRNNNIQVGSTYAVTLDLRIYYLSTQSANTRTMNSGECIYSKTYLHKLCLFNHKLKLSGTLTDHKFWEKKWSNTGTTRLEIISGRVRVMKSSEIKWQTGSFGTNQAPYYLHVIDGGPAIVVKNKKLEIIWSSSSYYDDTVAWNYRSYDASCGQMLGDSGKDGRDYVRYGIDMTLIGVGILPGGNYIYAAGAMAVRSYDEFGGAEPDSSITKSIFKCITDYADFRVDNYATSVIEDKIGDFRDNIDSLVAYMDSIMDSPTQNQQIWEASGSRHVTLGTTYTNVAKQGRELMPSAITWMTIRILSWANYMRVWNFRNSADIVAQINQEGVNSETKDAMHEFRERNGDIIHDYISEGLPLAWTSIMNDESITTDQRHRELDGIWMDGLVCDYWIPVTYALSRDTSDLSQSYIFGGYDFTEYSGDDCKAKVLASLSTYSGNSFNYIWDPKSAHGGSLEQWDAYCFRDVFLGIGDDWRCYGHHSDRYNTLAAGRTTNFIRAVTVSSFSATGRMCRETSEKIWRSFSVIDKISRVGYKDVRSGGTSTGIEQIVFFDPKNTRGSRCDFTPKRTIHTTQCDDGYIATGISFLRGKRMSDDGNFGYFLWKIRLMCRPYRGYGVDDGGYRIDDFRISNEAGAQANYPSERVYSWSPFYECAPGHAMYGIKGKEGWRETNGQKKIKIKYSVEILCRSLFDATIFHSEIPMISQPRDDPFGFKKTNVINIKYIVVIVCSAILTIFVVLFISKSCRKSKYTYTIIQKTISDDSGIDD